MKSTAFSSCPIRRVKVVGKSGFTQRFSAVKRPRCFEEVKDSGLLIAARSSEVPGFDKMIAFLSTSVRISKILLKVFKNDLTGTAGTVIQKKVEFFRLFLGSVLACIGGRTCFFPFK